MEKISDFKEKRLGRFTSSTIGDLMSNGKKAGEPGARFYSRCEKVAAQVIFGTAGLEQDSLQTEWGTLCEAYVSRMLKESEGVIAGFSDCTIAHPDFSDWWAGTPDCMTESMIYEIKTLLNVERYFRVYGTSVEKLKKDFDLWYWQIVSNCCITGKKYGKLVAFFPNKYDFENIKELNKEESFSFRIEWAKDDAIPYLGEGCDKRNLYMIEFEVEESEKEALRLRVEAAIKHTLDLLNDKGY